VWLETVDDALTAAVGDAPADAGREPAVA
jgi:hypothetical protein